MNTPTADFCEVLYCHYDTLIQACKDPGVKHMLQQSQEYYAGLHEAIVPFAKVVSTIDVINA